MKVAIIGSRDFKKPTLVWEYLIANLKDDDIVVSGGAKGPDSIGEAYAIKKGITQPIIFKPDWDKHGKKAGFIRNEQIINECDRVVAFWNGESKGTKHSISLAMKLGKPVEIIFENPMLEDFFKDIK